MPNSTANSELVCDVCYRLRRVSVVFWVNSVYYSTAAMSILPELA